MANSDRWLDRSILSRDLVDLSILRLRERLPQESIAKASAAYEVVEPLKRAITDFQQVPDYRERCYDLLSVAQPNVIVDGLDTLATDFGLPLTRRLSREHPPEGWNDSLVEES